MKICIPTLTNTGLDAQVHGHFGSAPYFILVDTASGAIEALANTNAHHAHGMCHPLGVLEGRHIDAVVCGGMGGRAVQKLNLAGIKAFRAAAGTVEEIIRQFNQGDLEEITMHNACAQHGCH